jgi:hypothetical protein
MRTASSPPTDLNKSQNLEIEEKPKKVNYKDALLNKFSKRTNERIIEQMRERDRSVPLYSKSKEEPLDKDEKDHLTATKSDNQRSDLSKSRKFNEVT